MRWFVGSDHAGYALKRHLSELLRGLGDEVADLGTDSEQSVDYPDYGAAVGRLLATCDPGRPGGVRDRAVITMLARLGLRAGEVAALTLEDVDWHRGQVMIHGKGARHEPVPLPADVGHELAAYLRARPPAPPGCRA